MQIITKILKISSNNYKRILIALKKGGGESRLIGGCVRDALIGKNSYDIDIATSFLPEEVMHILSKAKIKVIPTGIKFGTITAILNNEHFQITTLRKDVECNGRHSKVIFSKDFKEDAERRDFTINALSYCPFKNEIYDYFNGIEDLNQQKVIFIGDPAKRIVEDYLRILRFFRFSSYYSNNLDLQGLNACTNLREGLNLLSKERIKSEMDRLLISPNVSAILQAMFSSNILSLVFHIDSYQADHFIKANFFNLQLPSRYALLLYQNKALGIDKLLQLKYSKQEAAKILSIIYFINLISINELEIKKIWYEELDYKEYLFVAVITGRVSLLQVKSFIAKYDHVQRARFPLTGHDLLIKNVEHKNIGKQLEYLKNIWLESNCTKSKQELLQNLSILF